MICLMNGDHHKLNFQVQKNMNCRNRFWLHLTICNSEEEEEEDAEEDKEEDEDMENAELLDNIEMMALIDEFRTQH